MTGEADTARSGFGRIRALDGLRGLAVLAVFLYHDGFGRVGAVVAPGGFIGVDVFFALSGFLIATLLLVERRHTGRIDLRHFWVRRARRLIPALLLMLLGVALYAVTIAAPSTLDEIRAQAIATLLYFQNWYLAFTPHSIASPLSHTWSLSVEEQWYLIWPLLVVVAAGRSRRFHVISAATLAVASAVAMAWIYEAGHHSLAFYGTGSRIQELLVGALLAMVLVGTPIGRAGSAIDAAGWLSLALLTVVVLTASPDDHWLYFGGYFAIAIAAVLIVAALNVPGSRLGRVLVTRPLVALGVVSYGVYLFHWPLMRWLTSERTGLDGVALTALRAAATLAVAIPSYYFVEQPIRRGIWPRSMASLAGAAAAVAAVVVLATTGATRAPTVNEVGLRRAAAATPHGVRRVLVAGGLTPYLLATTRVPATVDDTRVAAAVALGCDASGHPAAFAASGRTPGRCRHVVRDWTRARVAYRPDASVLFVDASSLLDHRAGGVVVPAMTAAGAQLVDRTARDDAGAVRARGTRLVLALDLPCPGSGSGALASMTGDPARQAWLAAALRSFARSRSGVTVADYTGWRCAQREPSAFTERLGVGERRALLAWIASVTRTG